MENSYFLKIGVSKLKFAPRLKTTGKNVIFWIFLVVIIWLIKSMLLIEKSQFDGTGFDKSNLLCNCNISSSGTVHHFSLNFLIKLKDHETWFFKKNVFPWKQGHFWPIKFHIFSLLYISYCRFVHQIILTFCLKRCLKCCLCIARFNRFKQGYV